MLAVLALASQGLGQEGVRTTIRSDGTKVKGKITRIGDRDNMFVVQADGRDLTFYTNPQTTFRLRNRDARFADLQQGSMVNIIYDTQGDRFIASSVALADDVDVGVDAQVGERRTERRVTDDRPLEGRIEKRIEERRTDEGVDRSATAQLRGRISGVRLNPLQVYIRTTEGKEFALDLDSDREVTLTYEFRNGKYFVTNLDVAFGSRRAYSEPGQAGQTLESRTTTEVRTTPTILDGQIVRIEGTDQVVLKTNDGREIILNTQPQTVFRFNEQPARFSQFQSGMPVRVEVDERGGRRLMRGLFGGERRVERRNNR